MTAIAVLLTCHNRKDISLKCLSALLEQQGLEIGYAIEVFLVDDASIDGTTEAIKFQFPEVHVIQGDGNLFWNRGMYLAWQTAASAKEYDYYLWLNDDTLLDSNAIKNIFDDYYQIEKMEIKGALITGACRTQLEKDIFSYGGRSELGPILPNGKPQKCKYINGNIVLVSKAIYKELGNLSYSYTHAMGDFDYGLRALRAGYKCYTTSAFIATCAHNEGIPGWCNPEVPLKKRWELLHSPLGLNIKEYIQFRKKFWGIQWVNFAVKAYAKMMLPSLYSKITK